MSCPYEIQQPQLIRPVYRAMKHFNKPVKIGDIEEFVIQDLKLPPEIYNLISNAKNNGKEQTELHFRLNWVKTDFKQKGLLADVYAKWKLSEDAEKLTEDEVYEIVMNLKKGWKKESNEKNSKRVKKEREESEWTGNKKPEELDSKPFLSSIIKALTTLNREIPNKEMAEFIKNDLNLSDEITNAYAILSQGQRRTFLSLHLERIKVFLKKAMILDSSKKSWILVPSAASLTVDEIQRKFLDISSKYKKEYGKKWRENNPEKEKAARKEYYEKNKEKIIARRKEAKKKESK